MTFNTISTKKKMKRISKNYTPKKDILRERQTDTNVKQNIVVDAVLNYMFVQHQEKRTLKNENKKRTNRQSVASHVIGNVLWLSNHK